MEIRIGDIILMALCSNKFAVYSNCFDGCGEISALGPWLPWASCLKNTRVSFNYFPIKTKAKYIFCYS
jgi:hypothetical protein